MNKPVEEELTLESLNNRNRLANQLKELVRVSNPFQEVEPGEAHRVRTASERLLHELGFSDSEEASGE